MSESNGKQFLEGEVEGARSRYMAAFDRIRLAQQELHEAKSYFEVMSQALASFTANSANPYRPQSLPSVVLTTPPSDIAISRKDRQQTASQSDVRAPGVTKGKPLDMSLDSKAGILRNVVNSLALKPVTLGEIFNALPKDTSIKLSRGDLHRMLPRFVARGELAKDGHFYRLPHVPPSPDLFHSEGEG